MYICCPGSVPVSNVLSYPHDWETGLKYCQESGETVLQMQIEKRAERTEGAVTDEAERQMMDYIRKHYNRQTDSFPRQATIEA